MTQWAKSPQDRGQLVLFSKRLDEAVAADHHVRLLDDILGRLDWTGWEAKYHVSRGQPAIHPRVLASVLLYGLLTRVRSSRGLEEALMVRLDFRWLAEGRSIDHTTLSEFRRKHPEELKNLFVQIGLVAREMGWLSLEQLAYDGTRLRANNRRSGTRTPQRLHEMREELAAKFAELEAAFDAADAREEEVFGSASPHELSQELADVARRRAQVDAALAELKRIEEAGETTPTRLPLTDPQSRLTPNKEGGFAPNYTPLATVDVDSGLVVSADVIAMTDEDKHLLSALEDVKESFELETLPPEVLADGMMASGENLADLAEKNVTLYSPIPTKDLENNPAIRDDPSQPVAEADWDRLPTKTFTTTVNGTKQKQPQLEKSAFVYDEEQDCYWCPQGQKLPHIHTTSEQKSSGHRIWRRRYKADAAACAECPLKARCLKGEAKRRQINRDQHEELRNEQAKRMAGEEAKQKYKRRQHAGEFPFAIIKQHFGARQFLLRGLEQVKVEWLWLTSAFNLTRLFRLFRMKSSGVDPPTA
jgi:transposase